MLGKHHHQFVHGGEGKNFARAGKGLLILPAVGRYHTG
jgi:hypothetical protein